MHLGACIALVLCENCRIPRSAPPAEARRTAEGPKRPLMTVRPIRAVPLPRTCMGRRRGTDAGAGDLCTTIFHSVASCRLGSDHGAVTGPDLYVKGIEGLSIADASVIHPSEHLGHTPTRRQP